MHYIQQFAVSLWAVLLEAAPWLLFGLVVAGLIKVWVPANLLTRWLGGRGIGPVVRAALVGTPLPLCSCSVIPAAVTLRRSGASKGATVSFLIATPENGADSIALSYALLGPFMTVVRPLAAIVSAIAAGLLTAGVAREEDTAGGAAKTEAPDPNRSCCNDDGCGDQTAATTSRPSGRLDQLKLAIRYAAIELFDDIAVWLGVGLVLAALMNALIPPSAMTGWGSGLPAMLAMLVIGIPMYICATASTPVAAAMLIAGVSPGTVLVFLLAGPATNLGTVGIVRRELGTRAAISYLVGIATGALALGLITDLVISAAHINVIAQATEHNQIIPPWVSYLSVGILVCLGVCLLIRKWRGRSVMHDVATSPARARA